MEKYRQRLKERREDLENRLKDLKKEQRKGLKESVQVLSLYDQHGADLGTTTHERELDVGFMVDMEKELYLIKEALGRMEKGTYGICQGCGRSLPQKRLAVLPQAFFCKGCQQDLERGTQ